MLYKVPSQFYFPLHHVRPRFKGNIESVLLFFANACSRIGTCSCAEYARRLNKEIRIFPGNDSVSDKTINNWRTEIAALFGFYIENKNFRITETGEVARFLDHEQDLVQFFKYYLFKFQYPGGHIKADYVAELLEAGVRFKPAKYILQTLMALNHNVEEKTACVTKAEVVHCIFNDLRVTRDNRPADEVADLIRQNRRNQDTYITDGDVIRYAGDILDYMVLGNLLKESYGHYHLNTGEMESIVAFLQSEEWFDGYDDISGTREMSKIAAHERDWFDYVNKGLSPKLFKTDITTYLTAKATEDDCDYGHIIDAKIKGLFNGLGTIADIGELGETLVVGHEKKRLADAGRGDFVHLVKRIPTALSVGYDIQSMEIEGEKRYVEVKTTISHKPLTYLAFHLTPNEWDSATTLRDRYFVYRLLISAESRRLYILQNPVSLYKKDLVKMNIKHGAEISFKEDIAEKSELLIWDKN